MNLKDRAAYAWGRICNLFRKKKTSIKDKIEEEQEISLRRRLCKLQHMFLICWLNQ